MTGWPRAETAVLSWTVLRREVALEASGRDAAVTVLPVAAAVVLLSGLAFGPRPSVLAATAPGALWLAVLLAAVPLSDRGIRAERAEGSWDLLRAVVPSGALLVGKTAAVWLALSATWACAALLTVVLFGVSLPPSAYPAGFAGTLGVAALTVTFGAVTADGTRRPGLLGILLLPAALPVLLAGTQASTPGTSGGRWAALLVVFALVAVVAAWAVFPALVEE